MFFGEMARCRFCSYMGWLGHVNLFNRDKHIMIMSSIKKLVIAAVACLGSLQAYSVPVHINSGNPAYPFPQFLEYACGVNLGTQNPEGVVHIEMEQDIRDAYQIFANEWKYTNDVMDGVKYIQGNIGCPYDCREGDGYSMLAAAVMGDKESFDGLWFRIHDSFRPTSTSYLTGAKVADGGYGNLIIGDQVNSCVGLVYRLASVG